MKLLKKKKKKLSWTHDNQSRHYRYTCNACNETFRKIQCLEHHVKAENVHTAIK